MFQSVIITHLHHYFDVSVTLVLPLYTDVDEYSCLKTVSPDSKDDFFPSDQYIIDHNDLDSYSSPLSGRPLIAFRWFY